MHLKRELNPDFLNNFLDYLYTIKSYSFCYIISLNYTIRSFLSFIIEKYKYNIDIQNFKIEYLRILNKENIYDYIFFLAKNNLKLSSIYVKLNHLRSFFKYLYKIPEYHLFLNPTVNLKDLSFKKYKDGNLPNILSVDECKMLLNKEFYDFNEKLDIRDYCILTLFLNTGLRASELTSIKIQDIDFDNKTILVNRKRKQRTYSLFK